jgi:hypothetical protein
MKIKKTSEGYISECGRFRFIKDRVASYRNGCWKTAWHLLDNGKLFGDRFEEKLSDCRENAEQILEDGE